ESVVSAGEEGLPTVSPRPARLRICRGDELRRHRGRGAEGRVVQHSQVLVNPPARHIRRQALRSLDTTLPVRIGPDEAGIYREAFTAHQPLGHAAAHYRL